MLNVGAVGVAWVYGRPSSAFIGWACSDIVELVVGNLWFLST